MPIRAGDIVSHAEMCAEEKRNLQQGMNFRPNGRRSVILMSVRPGAPYADRLEDGGRVLIYEGHDEPRSAALTNPKSVDQPQYTRYGRLSQNGLFAAAAQKHRDRGDVPELVSVLADEGDDASLPEPHELEHNRVIPSDVKLTVWKRDDGKCVQCGSRDNLHFDHILPFSKGGSSLAVENVQLLCARHNLQKSARIQ